MRSPRGDGYHGIGIQPEGAAGLVRRIRAERPDEERFTISLRVPWDAKATDPAEMRAQRETYEAAGVQHLVVAPERGDMDSWLTGMQTIAGAIGLCGPFHLLVFCARFTPSTE